ncbi:translesion DNA synthesis-associated protein ImuA [Gammaproteobacteria bacterium]|jgi:cell division inhibitor SulA/protein ImuA|nr:translesion DNA synthesis-associated protein ImuA [Gammaproteobacteria bacterium]
MRRDTSPVDKLLENPRLWRGRNPAQGMAGLASGYAELDRHLPGGGWPRQALTEILIDQYGIGELRLLMPALARLSADDDSADVTEPGWIAWVAPPFQPYPPALQEWGINLSRMLIVRPKSDSEMLWSAEQALSSGTCAAVMLWPAVLDDQASRRLQLAAEKGSSWAIAFRPLAARVESSAAALRIALQAGQSGTRLSILKSRGGRPAVLHDVL